MTSTVHANQRAGSVPGGILLITGSCIGAGMLALPVITGLCGFIPSTFFFLLAWLFMTTTALLLLEANLTLGYELSLISMAKATLGRGGKALCWILFLFLFYSLGVAYIAASGSIFQSLLGDLFHTQFPDWAGSLIFTALFGLVTYAGARPVDYLNRVLMVGLIVTYCALILMGSRFIKLELLTHQRWSYAFGALPILIISFGYHNMIPSLCDYFKGDRSRLRLTLFVGSLVPLVIYLVWEAVMLGIIPLEGREGLLSALDQGQAATQALRAVVGKSWIATIGEAFALFAIVTSFLTQSLSLVDFLSDGLKIPKVKLGRVFLVLLTLGPPLFLAFLNPGIFIRALQLAGGFSAVVLFGVFPALMIWVLRYKKKTSLTPILPLGKIPLLLVLFFAAGVFLLQLAGELGWTFYAQ